MDSASSSLTHRSQLRDHHDRFDSEAFSEQGSPFSDGYRSEQPFSRQQVSPKQQSYALASTIFYHDNDVLETDSLSIAWDAAKQRLLDQNIERTHRLASALIKARRLPVQLFPTDKIVVKEDRIKILNTLTNTEKKEIPFTATPADQYFIAEAHAIIETAKLIYGHTPPGSSASSSAVPSPASTASMSPPRALTPDPRIANIRDLDDEIADLEGQRAALIQDIDRATGYLRLAREQNVHLDEEIERKEERIEELEQEEARLERIIHDLDARRVALEDEVARLNRENTDLTRTNGDLLAEETRLNDLIRDLGTRIAALDAQKQDLERTIVDAKRELATLTQENKRLAEDIKFQNLEIQRLTRRSTTLTAAVDALQRRKDVLEVEVARLTGEEARLTTAIRDLDARKFLLEGEKADLEGQIALATTENQRLNLANVALTSRNADLERQIRENEDLLRRLDANKARLTGEIAGLESRKEALLANIAALGDDNSRLERLNTDLRALNAALGEEREGFNAQIEELSGRSSRLEQEIDEKTSDRDALDRDIASRNAKVGKLEKDERSLEAAIRLASEKRAAIDTEIVDLRSQMRRLAEEFSRNQTNNAALANRNAELSTAIDILGCRKKTLDQEIASKTAELGRKHNELEGLQRTIESLGLEQDQLQADIASELREFAEVKELREALDEAVSANSRLQQTVDHHAEMFFANAEQIRVLERQVASLQGALRIAEVSNDSSSRDSKAQLEQARAQLEQARANIANLSGQISRLGEELRLAQFENRALTSENEDLRSSLADRDIQIVDLEGRLEEAREYKHEFLIRKRALERKEDQLSEADELIDAKSKAIHRLQQNNIRQAKRLEELAADKAGYQRAHKAACFEITRLEGLLESFKQTNRDLRAELAEVSANLEHFAEEAYKAGKANDVLERKIARLTTEKAELEEALNESRAAENVTYNEMADIAKDRQAIYKQKLKIEKEAARLSEENRDLTQELRALQLDYYNSQADNEILRDELASLRLQLAERDATLEEAGEYGIQLVASLKAAECANAKLKVDNADLASGYDLAQREKSDLAAKLRAQALELEAAKAQIVSQAALLEQARKDILAEQERAIAALAERDVTIHSLEGKVSTLADTNAEQARQIRELEQQIGSLGSQIRSLGENLASKDSEIDRAGEQLRQVTNDNLVAVEALESQIQGLRHNLETAGKDNTALKASTARQIEELLEAKSTAAVAFEARIGELSSTIEASGQEKLDLARDLGELRRQKETLTAQLATATGTIGALEKDNDALQEEIETRRSEIARLGEVVSEKDIEIQSIKEQLARLTLEKETAVGDFEKEKETLLAKLRELELENIRQKKTISDQQKQLLESGADIEARRAKETRFEANNAQLTDEINALHQRLLAISQEKQTVEAALGKRIANLETELGRAKQQQLEQSTSLSDQIESLQRANQELSTSNAQNAAELARLQREKDALIEALLAPDQAKIQRKGNRLEQLAFQMEFIAEATSAMNASDLSALAPEQLRALQTNYLLLHLDLDSEKLVYDLGASGKARGISSSFEDGFKDDVIEGLSSTFTQPQVAAHVKAINPASVATISKSKAKADPEAETKYKALNSFSTQLERMQSPIIASYNSGKEPSQRVNTFISYPPIEPVLKNLFDFTDLQPSEHLITLERVLQELESGDPSSNIREIKEQKSQILKEKLRLNIIRICSTTDPWFPKDIISLRIILDTFKIGVLTKHNNLRRLNDATTSTLVALRKIFDELNTTH